MTNAHTPELTNSPASGVSPRRQARGIHGYLLIVGSCMPALGAVLIAPVLPAMAAAFPDTPGVGILVPLILTMPALIIAFFAPFAGLLLDRFGRKRILLIAMVAYAGFGTAPLWLDTLPAILASRAGLGLCEALILTGCLAMTTEYFEGRAREKYLGYQAAISTLAATLFLMVGGILGQSGWRTPFWLYGMSLIIALAMYFLLWEPEARTSDRVRVKVPWKAILMPCLVTLFGGLVFFSVVAHMPFVLAGLGLHDPGAIGIASAITALAGAVASYSFRWLARWGTHRLLTLAFTVAAAGFVIVSFAANPMTATAGAVVANLGAGLMLPTLVTWTVSRLSHENLGAGSGIWQSSLWIGQFSTSIIIGAIAASLGGQLGTALGILGIASLVMAILVGTLWRRIPKLS